MPRESVEVDLTSDNTPYVGYTPSQLYAFLGSYRLQREPGSKWEYSNIGMGLLGHALALRAGVSYEDLLRRRIFEPLSMTTTMIIGHSGGTFGFQSRLIVDTTRKRAVVAWINGRGAAVNDLVGLVLDRPRLQ